MSSSSSSSPWEKFLTLRSNDGRDFTVKESVAVQSAMIKKMVKDGRASSTIHLSRIDSGTLAMVLEYLYMKYGDSEVSTEDKQKYDPEELAKKLSLQELFTFSSAAVYLDIKGLPEVLYQATCDHIKKIPMPDAPMTSGLENDLTPEEDEEDIRTEYPSDFDN